MHSSCICILRHAPCGKLFDSTNGRNATAEEGISECLQRLRNLSAASTQLLAVQPPHHFLFVPTYGFSTSSASPVKFSNMRGHSSFILSKWTLTRDMHAGIPLIPAAFSASASMAAKCSIMSSLRLAKSAHSPSCVPPPFTTKALSNGSSDMCLGYLTALTEHVWQPREILKHT